MNAETFNALYEVGIPVFAYPGCRPEHSSDARRIVTRTRTEAKSVGLDRDGVVWVEDHGAYIALTHVDVVTEDEWEAAKTDDAVAAQGALPMPAGPDFFQPGHTYTNSEFPQYGWKFRCDAITTHPEDGERTALGWRFFKGEWDAIAYGEDDWDVHNVVGIADASEAAS